MNIYSGIEAVSLTFVGVISVRRVRELEQKPLDFKLNVVADSRSLVSSKIPAESMVQSTL